MIFYPSIGDLRTDLKLLQYPTHYPQFHDSKDSTSQQEFGEGEHLAASWIGEQKWSSIEHQIYESLHIKKMALSLPKKIQVGDANLEKELIWFPKIESNPSFSNPFIQFIQDSNQDERNNNNVNLKGHLMNFPSLKKPGYCQQEEEDEKENMGWISNNMALNNMIIRSNKSPPSKDDTHKSNLLNVCLLLHDDDSSSYDPYVQWNDNNANQLLQQDQKLESIILDGGHEEEGGEQDTVVVEQQEQELEEYGAEEDTTSKEPDEMDTLLTFLSKFDEKVAAIWGNNISETIHTTNPWENERTTAPVSIFDYQQIENETSTMDKSGHGVRQLGTSYALPTGGALEKTLGPNSLTKSPSLVGPFDTAANCINISVPEYVIIHDEKNNSNLTTLLNHSDERSGFIKFIPNYSDQKQTFKFSNNFHKLNQLEHKANGSLKEMLNNLELEEEQEIVAACSQPLKSLDEGPTNEDDLLTSWKTHFRPVGAMETQIEPESPTISLNHPQLPEFRTSDYMEKDYVLYQRASSTAFQVRFKLCRENEKGNQTEEISRFSFNPGFDFGSFQQTPLITDYGDYSNQLYGWLSGPFEKETRDGIEDFSWSDGRFMDPWAHNMYCEDAFDDYENKTTNDIDSDAAFCFTGGSSNHRNNEQSKVNRRRVKGRPCKYFFMDGLCKRGNECKFSHDVITCRFWAEGGTCLKDSCPFLHCFLDAKDFESHDSLGHKILDTKYQLESESDFPALGSTKISSRVPIISENGSKVMDIIFDDEGITLNKKSEDEEEEAGWPQHQSNWICSLISTNEKRKKKK